MGIDSYNFIEDVRFYLSDFINTNTFKVYNDFDTDLTQAVFLENEKVKIWLTTLENFPYQSVTFKLYYNKNIIGIQEVLHFWQLTMKEFDIAYLELTKNIPYPTNSEFKGYQKDLLVIKALLSDFYFPITMV